MAMTMHEAPDAAALLATDKENAALNADVSAGGDAASSTPNQYKLRGLEDRVSAYHRRLASSPGVTLDRDCRRMATEREKGIADLRRVATDAVPETQLLTQEAGAATEKQEPRRYAPVEPPKRAQLARKKDAKEATPQPVVPDMIIECVLDQHGYVKTRTYRKGKFLGKGGFARCYEMTCEQTGATYAGKVVAKASLVKPMAKQKFTSEIKIHKSLHHPNVVQFEHFFDDADNSYILLELCRNQSLSDLLRRRKTLSEPEVRFYIRQLVDGLMYLHANLVIHRDLKLGNLFLTSDMRLKIGDFGLAARLDDPNDRKTTMCGTPNYIAPEILRGTRGEGHSFEVDVWSMGVVMYTLLVGRPPFETDDVKDTYKRIRALQYAFPEDTRVSPNAQSLIRGILRTDPYQRPSLSDILQHPFFADEPMPTSLPSTALLVTPPPVMKKREPMTAPVSGALRVPVHPQAPTGSSSSARRQPLRHRDADNVGRTTPSTARDEYNLLQQRASDPGVPERRNVVDNAGGRTSEYATGTTSRHTFTESGRRGPTRATEVPRRTVIDLTKDAAPKSGSSSATASSPASSCSGDVDVPRNAMEATYRTLSQLFTLQENGGEDTDKLSGFSSATAIVTAARQVKELRSEAEAFLAGTSPEPAALWVLQWVDYTSKYGIGYLLSNRCAGVYFNDSTKMIAEAGGRAFDYIERAPTAETAPVRTRYSTERYDKSLAKKVTLLGHFRGYLVDSQAENEEVQTLERQLTLAHGDSEPMQADDQNSESPLVFVQKWVKTRHAVLFQLSNGSFQFNFFDTSKLVLSGGGRVVSYLDREGSLSAFACSVAVLTQERPDLAKRLKYARDMLHQMVKP